MVSGCRKRLFNMINDLPTIFEVVTGAAKVQFKDKSSGTNHSGSKSKTNLKTVHSYLIIHEDMDVTYIQYNFIKFYVFD